MSRGRLERGGGGGGGGGGGKRRTGEFSRARCFIRSPGLFHLLYMENKRVWMHPSLGQVMLNRFITWMEKKQNMNICTEFTILNVQIYPEKVIFRRQFEMVFFKTCCFTFSEMWFSQPLWNVWDKPSRRMRLNISNSSQASFKAAPVLFMILYVYSWKYGTLQKSNYSQTRDVEMFQEVFTGACAEEPFCIVWRLHKVKMPLWPHLCLPKTTMIDKIPTTLRAFWSQRFLFCLWFESVFG